MALSPARDGEEFAVEAAGTGWSIAWHGLNDVPAGTNHGANAFCVTDDDHVVLISDDGDRWGWPGGRPEGDESWEQTMRREVLEETCCEVTAARLLGFSRAVGIKGPEEGKVLVRAIWRATVKVMPWNPKFEVRHRRLVPKADLVAALWMESGFEPLYHRALREAGLGS